MVLWLRHLTINSAILSLSTNGSSYVKFSGCFINVRLKEGLSMVALQVEDPFGVYEKRRDFLPGSHFIMA